MCRCSQTQVDPVQPDWRCDINVPLRTEINQSINQLLLTLLHLPEPLLSLCVCLQADNDQVMGFQQCFVLKNINDAWVCTNDMFRLAIYNFG